MTTPRITVSVSADQYEHVERLADELDVSMAEVIRRLILTSQSDSIKTDALVHREVHHMPDDQLTHGMAIDRIDALEDRLDALEARVDDLETDDDE